MKAKKTIILALILIPVIVISQIKKEEFLNINSKAKHAEKKAFKNGETLEYLVYYGFVDAGIAKLEVKEEPNKFTKKGQVYRVIGTGESKGAFNWFFKVRDRYETFIDKDEMYPHHFIRNIQEGGYKKEQEYKFSQNQNKVITNKDQTFEIPDKAQDMLSAFYFGRSLDFSNAKIGEIFVIESFVDEEVYPLKIKFAGFETVTVKTGTFNCMVFHPVVQQGRIFKHEDDLTVWVTNDQNKIPVLAKAKVLVGSIKMELINYEGVNHPLARK